MSVYHSMRHSQTAAANDDDDDDDDLVVLDMVSTAVATTQPAIHPADERSPSHVRTTNDYLSTMSDKQHPGIFVFRRRHGGRV